MPWELTDYQVFTPNTPIVNLQAPSNQPQAGAIIQLQAVAGGQIWRIERISVQVFLDPTADTTPIAVAVYDQAPGGLIIPADQTTIAPGPETLPTARSAQPVTMPWDVGDESAPITVTEGNQLTIVFSSYMQVIGDSVAAARIQAQILQGRAGAPTPVAGSQPPPAIPPSL